MSAPFVINHVVGTTVGNTPAVCTDNALTNAATGKVGGSRPSGFCARKVFVVAVVPFKDQSLLVGTKTIKIVQRSPVNITQDQQDSVNIRLAFSKVKPSLGFTKCAKINRIGIADSQLCGSQFGNQWCGMYSRLRGRLALKLFNPTAIVIHAVAPVEQWCAV